MIPPITSLVSFEGYLAVLCAIGGVGSMGAVCWAVFSLAPKMERAEKRRAMNALIYRRTEA